MKRLFLLVGLLLGFAASGWAETKTDTIYFEFELDEGAASAGIQYGVSGSMSMDYNDGQEHDRISHSGGYNQSHIYVNGNGYGRIYYTYEQPREYSICFRSHSSSYDKQTIRVYTDPSVHITLLKVSGCTALTSLNCSSNQLTELDASGCTALTSLYCGNNQLTELDVSKNTALTSLECENNQLTELDVSKNTALTSLYCSNNQLTELDVSGCTALTSLYCYNNQLTSLNASGCAITSLIFRNAYYGGDYSGIGGNPLKILNLSGCTALTKLEEFYDKQMTLMELDVSNCTALTELWCYNNQLTKLDASGCTALTSLKCDNNQLTELDASGCTALTELWCDDNQLTELDASGCTALTKLHCSNNHIPLSQLYDIYNLSSDWTDFRAWNQWDSISLLIEEPWDLSSERLIGSMVSDYSISYNWISSDDLYTEQEFLFQFHKPDYCQLRLENETLPSAYFTWYVSVEPQDGYFVHVSSSWGGTAAITGSGIYQEGEEVTIIATKYWYLGYRFVNWTKEDGSVFSTEAEYTFTVTENLRLTANFEEIPKEEMLTISLLSSNQEWGEVYINGDWWRQSGTYEEGTEITIMAYPLPNPACRFVNWTEADGSVFSTEVEYTFTVTENLELTANFEENFTIELHTSHPDCHASVSFRDVTKEGWKVLKTDVSYDNSSFRFINWTKQDGTVFSTEAEYTFTLTEDLELTANFERIPGTETFTVNLSANNPAWGDCYITPYYYKYGTYNEGEELTIQAYPAWGYRFVNWTKADGSVFSTQAEYTFIITENLDLTANFEKDPNGPGDVANENQGNDNFAVYVQGRTIYLSEPRGAVQVFNTAGQCVYNGSSTVIPAPHSGVYIVRVGTKNYKVIVR